MLQYSTLQQKFSQEFILVNGKHSTKMTKINSWQNVFFYSELSVYCAADCAKKVLLRLTCEYTEITSWTFIEIHMTA